MMVIRYEVRPECRAINHPAEQSDNQNFDLEDAIIIQNMVDVLLEGAFGGQPMNKDDLLQRGFSKTEIEIFGEEAVSICRRQSVRQVRAGGAQ